MIAKLSGLIDYIGDDYLIIDVQGVGYHVFASRTGLRTIGQPGEPVSMLIDIHVREDHIHLYGFRSAAEQQAFRLLTSVQGVGARVGLAILSVCPPDKLVLAIGAQDKAPLNQAEGVGPKLATRIVTELKDKVAKLDLTPGTSGAQGAPLQSQDDAQPAPAEAGERGTTSQVNTSMMQAGESSGVSDQDAVSALVNLGYGRSDAFSAVVQARRKAGESGADQLTLQSLIRHALKELAQ